MCNELIWRAPFRAAFGYPRNWADGCARLAAEVGATAAERSSGSRTTVENARPWDQRPRRCSGTGAGAQPEGVGEPRAEFEERAPLGLEAPQRSGEVVDAASGAAAVAVEGAVLVELQAGGVVGMERAVDLAVAARLEPGELADVGGGGDREQQLVELGARSPLPAGGGRGRS